MTSYLIRDAHLLAMDGEALGTLETGDVAIEGDRIAGVGRGLDGAGAEVIDGRGMISLSPKGITGLVIEGFKPKVEFQDKFYRTSVKPTRDTSLRFPVPVGDAQAIVLSFGPDLTWLYTYLTAEIGAVKSAKLHIQTDHRTETLTDDTFPFEFSLPLQADDEAALTLLDRLNQTVIGTGADNKSIRHVFDCLMVE